MERRSTYGLEGVRRATATPQRALIERATEVLRADERVLAGWLVGSFAVGNADAFSDVDLQCLVLDAAADDLRDSWPALMEAITPVVKVTPFPGTIGGSAITPDWLHLDLVVNPEGGFDAAALEGWVPLFDKGSHLPEAPVPRPDRAGEPFFPSWLVEWFLYMLGASVGVVGRNEVVPGANGVTMVRDVAIVGLLLAENGLLTTREHQAPNNPFPFTKRLRPYLTDEQNDVLESLPPVGPTIDSVVDGYRAAARVFLPRAKALAAATGGEWPAAYEAATLRHFHRGLGVPAVDPDPS